MSPPRLPYLHCHESSTTTSSTSHEFSTGSPEYSHTSTAVLAQLSLQQSWHNSVSRSPWITQSPAVLAQLSLSLQQSWHNSVSSSPGTTLSTTSPTVMGQLSDVVSRRWRRFKRLQRRGTTSLRYFEVGAGVEQKWVLFSSLAVVHEQIHPMSPPSASVMSPPLADSVLNKISQKKKVHWQGRITRNTADGKDFGIFVAVMEKGKEVFTAQIKSGMPTDFLFPTTALVDFDAELIAQEGAIVYAQLDILRLQKI